MDYCGYGSLDKVVKDDNFKYTLYDALNWSCQLADALSFLHSKKIGKLIKLMNLCLKIFAIVHRDVKLTNTLLKDNYHTTVLTDYGTATKCETTLSGKVGTPSM